MKKIFYKKKKKIFFINNNNNNNIYKIKIIINIINNKILLI